MLKALKFVHIGDVHFPEARKQRLQDIKDPGFPGTVSDLVCLRPLALVARALTSVLEEKPNALLFTGDLTSYGDPDGYRACLAYFDEMLDLKHWDADLVHAVPGNHDVDRTKIDSAGKDLLPKFAEFAEAWRGLGTSILAVDQLRVSSLPVGRDTTSGAALISINSSLGCGERRYPEAVRKGLIDILDRYAATVPPDKAFKLLGEDLDTPAFDHSLIEELCHSIDRLDSDMVPFVVSHHNLLAQAIPRISIYSELLNAGVLRSRLSHLQRPIVYCHGHIHDYPVEVISEPEFDRSQVICISAPQFIEGFNVISVEYSASGTPLGCLIQSYRLSIRDGQVRPTVLRVPFHSPTYSNVRKFCLPLLQEIFVNLSEDDDTRFEELVIRLKLKPQQKRILENALLEGEWLGAVRLIDKREDSMHWVVKKVIR